MPDSHDPGISLQLETVFPSASTFKSTFSPSASPSAIQANLQAEANLRAFHHALSSMSLPLPRVLQGGPVDSRFLPDLIHNNSLAAKDGHKVTLPGGASAGSSCGNATNGTPRSLHPQAHQSRHSQRMNRTGETSVLVVTALSFYGNEGRRIGQGLDDLGFLAIEPHEVHGRVGYGEV